MSPGEFWTLSPTEFWWWFETIIPEEVIQRNELSAKLRAVQAAEKAKLNGS